MAHEYQDEATSDSRVLFGRVAFWGVAIILAFTLGRCTASDGVPRQDLIDANNTIADQQEQLTNASEAAAAAAAGGAPAQASPAATPTTTGSPTATATGASEQTSAAPEEGQTYVVQSGDTLGGIAARFYGDPAMHTLIQEANDLDDGSPLQRGQELIIPPEPEG